MLVDWNNRGVAWGRIDDGDLQPKRYTLRLPVGPAVTRPNARKFETTELHYEPRAWQAH